MPAFLTQNAILAVLHAVTAVAGLCWIGAQLRLARARELPDAEHPRWAWLRWAAMVAFLGAWAIVTVRSARGVPFRVPSMTLFMTSVVVASMQWSLVWFVVWPGVATGGARAVARVRAALRLNVATSIPMAFFFAASAWAQELGGGGRWIPARYWGLTLAVYGALFVAAMALPRLIAAALRPLVVALVVGAVLPLTLRWV